MPPTPRPDHQPRQIPATRPAAAPATSTTSEAMSERYSDGTGGRLSKGVRTSIGGAQAKRPAGVPRSRTACCSSSHRTPLPSRPINPTRPSPSTPCWSTTGISPRPPQRSGKRDSEATRSRPAMSILRVLRNSVAWATCGRSSACRSPTSRRSRAKRKNPENPNSPPSLTNSYVCPASSAASWTSACLGPAIRTSPWHSAARWPCSRSSVAARSATGADCDPICTSLPWPTRASARHTPERSTPMSWGRSGCAERSGIRSAVARGWRMKSSPIGRSSIRPTRSTTCCAACRRPKRATTACS